jgi:threonine 3-dehydrogenase
LKAIRKTVPKPGVEVQELEEPKIKPSEVLVKVDATAICGSDLHLYRWDQQTTRWNSPLPMTIGHEFSGKVVEVGSNVKLLKTDDRIAGESHIPCGLCQYCRTGNMHVCQNMQIFGIQTKEGSFAQYAAVPEIIAYKLPQSVSYEQGAVLEPFGVAVHAIERVGIEAGDVVLVIGSGPIGIFAQQLATVSGASNVIAVDRMQFRLDLAKRIGSANTYLNADKEDVVKRTMELTNGRGADVVVELAGTPVTTVQALQAVKKCGRVALVGLSDKPVQVEPTSMIIYKEATVFGSTGRSMFGTWERMVTLVESKKINPSAVVTDRLPLDRAEDGFQRVMKGNSGKVVFTPN